MTEEVLEQKIDNLTEHINNLNVSMRKDDETYKAILSKIARRLDELDTEENLDVIEIKDRLKFLSSQLDDNDLTPNIDELAKIINDLKMKQNISFDQIAEDLESSREHREESFRQFKELAEEIEQLQNLNNEKILAFEDKIDDLKNENNAKTDTIIEEIKKVQDCTNDKNYELIEKVQEINNNVSDQNKNAINEIKNAQNESNDRLNGLLNELKDDINNLRENYHELHGLSHDVKNNISDVISNIENKFNNISSTLNSSQENYKENVENQLNKLRQELVEEQIKNLREEITNITESIKNAIVEAENGIRGNVYEIVEDNEQKYNDLLDAQNSMRDEIKDVISTNLDDVKGQIYDSEKNLKNAVKAFINDYSNEAQITDKLDYIMESVSDINQDTADLSGAIEALKYTTQETCDNTSDIKDYLNSTKDDLKNNLRDLQEQFVLQMMQLFDNISFSEETEEIINFVDGINYEIKAELDTLQKEIDKISNKDDTEFFNTHFNNLCDLVSKQSSTEFSLLKEVASEIKKITASSENEGENAYSLPDIESDLAKIRLILKELQTSKLEKDEQEIDFSERFEILNEDISSISKRTNKLILTSEDTNKKFKSYLDEFKGIMNNFSQKNRQRMIEQKVDSVARLVMSNAKSAQILNEAFMHFAQWIDDSSEVMSANRTFLEAKTSALQDQMQTLNEKFESKIAENKELQMTIEKQNKLILKLEAKIEKSAQVEVNIDNDTKSMIEYIASQTSTTADNTKDNKNLTAKLEFLEHKISTLSKNIQKIISYIDEE